MVRLSLTLLLAAVAPFALAENGKCTNHRLYCGHTLTSGLGWNLATIQKAVANSDWNGGNVPSYGQIPQSLFKCGASGDSLVWVNNRLPCNNCVDGGSGQSDYCG